MTTPQFTYGCSDGIPGRTSGGWGVLHRSADLPPELEERFLTLVSDDLPSTLPDFPSKQQLADRPVRFRVFPDQSGTGAVICRSVEAGLDHTRRPGNVFTHAARVPRGEAIRATDFWFSPDWLSPFGAEQVRLAVPGDELGLPTVAGFADVAVQFRNERLARALPWMIDALCHALFAKRQVAIVEPESAKCALWLGLLSWAVAERTAYALSFAIYEDRRTAPLMLDRAVLAVGVPDQATAASLGPRVLVLDPTWDPDDTQAAITGRWTLPSGSTVPRTEWARVMTDLVWAETETATRAFETREGLAESLRRLQALPTTSEAELAILHLAYLAESQSASLNRQVVRDHLEVLPPTALARNALLRRLAENAGVDLDGPKVVQPTVTLSARPNPSAGRVPGPPAANAQDDPPPKSGDDTGHEPTGDDDPLTLPDADVSFAVMIKTVTDARAPTPRSAANAAFVLAHLGLKPESIATSEGFVSEFVTGGTARRVALLHAATQLMPDPLGPEALETVFRSVALDETFERLAPGLLVLACRCHLSHPASMGATAPAWRALGVYVSQRDADELSYLTIYFSAMLEVLEDGTARSRQDLELLAMRQAPSVWSLSNREGTPLVVMVLDDMAPAHGELPATGRRIQR